MKISYDQDADAIYIEFISNIQQVKTVKLSDTIALDFGKGEVLAGIEILDAKESIGNGSIPPVVLQNLTSHQSAEIFILISLIKLFSIFQKAIFLS
jgi:uncharacterized protein YuzE